VIFCDLFALIKKVRDGNVYEAISLLWCQQYGTNLSKIARTPTKPRCRFTQHLPNKLDRFGIKFWLACDVEGRNVTTVNFFTSAPLASKLLAKKTTLVGTIRGNKRELPNICKTKKDTMVTFSSKLYKSSGYVLTIYKNKPKKRVFVLSSKHKSLNIQKTKKLLPETVEFYNKIKFGVDIADQMAKKYSVKSGSSKWPLQVFFNILDLGGIKAWILCKDTTGEKYPEESFFFNWQKNLPLSMIDLEQLMYLQLQTPYFLHGNGVKLDTTTIIKLTLFAINVKNMYAENVLNEKPLFVGRAPLNNY